MVTHESRYENVGHTGIVALAVASHGPAVALKSRHKALAEGYELGLANARTGEAIDFGRWR